MVLFGQHPSQGTLLKASQFLVGKLFVLDSVFSELFQLMASFRCFPFTHVISDTEELPVRLAHRVKELDELPYNLSEMPSIRKVKNWYAQSFEVGYPTLRSLTPAKNT